MKRRPRIRYTEEQKTLMWDRWNKGDSLREIAAYFDRYHTSISTGAFCIAETGDHCLPSQGLRCCRARLAA